MESYRYGIITIHERSVTMAYRYGESMQSVLFPQSIEEYVPADDPVRVYSEVVDALDLEKLGMVINEQNVGNAAYHPRLMLKLLVYAYSYGWRSSRTIERAIYHNVSFMWIMNGLKPDHKTIAEFRRNNVTAIKKVLCQCARLCIEIDLIEGSSLFVDGTKIRAQASRNRNYTKKQYVKLLSELNKRIDTLLQQCEHIDQEEHGNRSLVTIKKELRDKQRRKAKIVFLVEQFNEEDAVSKTINETDPESRILKSVQGSHASYNVQSTVDEKNGLIVSVEATNAPNDHDQLSKQVTHAENTLQKECDAVCADAGYYDIDDLAEIDSTKTIVVPNQEQASEKEIGPFHKNNFIYNETEDYYVCPKGHTLNRSSHDKSKNCYQYRMRSAKTCKQCEHYGICTTGKRGRGVRRSVNEETHEKARKTYASKIGQALYAKRKERVEHPFGHIKRNLGLTQFLMRGKDGVNAEMSLVATSFNVARIITLSGGVMQAINTLKSIA